MYRDLAWSTWSVSSSSMTIKKSASSGFLFLCAADWEKILVALWRCHVLRVVTPGTRSAHCELCRR